MKTILAVFLALLTVSAWAQTTGQMAYDVYNGSVFEQRLLTPSEGKVLTWQGGVLVNGNASGAVAWGDITGTLSGQTDLQTALDARQPLDADLTALAALSGTNAMYYRSAANTWSAVTIGSNLTFSGGTLSASKGVPGGSGTEIQFRSSATLFGGVTGSGWDGTTLTLPPLTSAGVVELGAVPGDGDGFINLWDAFNAEYREVRVLNGVVSIDGDVSANAFSGSGSGLTDLNATQLTSGTLPAARLPAPTTTALGGVQRNTGTAGQFVSGISALGALEYGTPVGGVAPLCEWGVRDNQPTGSSFATLQTRNNIPVLEFDDASVESGVFSGILPTAASVGSGLVVRIVWAGKTATSGNVRWRVEFERVGTDLDADSFDTATESTAAANGTSGIPTTTSITATSLDGLQAGEFFRVRVSRVGNDGTNDTMSGDAQLIAVRLMTP